VTELRIRPFEPSDQAAASALVLAGLVEHWGFLDASLNPDLKDISHSYAAGCFLVAELDGQLVGTGAYLPAAENDPGGPAAPNQAFMVVRMTVDRRYRRRGIGQRILQTLLKEAQRRGASQVILETTSTWQDAVTFYLENGFSITGECDGDTYFKVLLPAPPLNNQNDPPMKSEHSFSGRQ
jgi:GNAT superfamily N-acetyltransferase